MQANGESGLQWSPNSQPLEFAEPLGTWRPDAAAPAAGHA